MDLYRAKKEDIIAKAQEYADDIDRLDDAGHELYLEQSAYSPFEFKWRMARHESYVWQNIGRIHYINEVMMDMHAESLPSNLTAYLVDNMTSSDTYGKCIACGGEIEDGHHIISIGHSYP